MTHKWVGNFTQFLKTIITESPRSHLKRPNTPPALVPYATVSYTWQQRVEAVTFAHITLTPARLASPLAAQALTPDRVRRFVRSVRVDVLLPLYDEGGRGRRENDAEKAENNAAFTDVVRKVFALLSSTPASISAVQVGASNDHGGGDNGVDAAKTGYRPRIRFSMAARCVSDVEDMEARQYRRRVGMTTRPKDIFEVRYESSYLDLWPVAVKSIQDESEALPELHCISQFYVKASGSLGYRKFAPRALCLMASRMSGLERVDWELCDNEKRDVALRKKLRTDFANTLQTLPFTLRHFTLLYERRPPMDHSFQTPSILDETDRDNNDKLSLTLHKLSHRLTTFNLIADVGPEIFWPLEPTELDRQQRQQQREKGDNNGDSNPSPLWPSMERYSIAPGAIAPSGQWRFLRRSDASDLEYSDDDADSYVSDNIPLPGDGKEDPFREQLDPDAVGPLLLAAARAAGRMPTLYFMFFVLNPPVGEPLDVTYQVIRGGRLARGGGAGVGPAKLYIETHPIFHPEEEVMQAWRAAAREHTGEESGFEVTIKDSMERKLRRV